MPGHSFEFYKNQPGFEVVDCSNSECGNQVVGRKTLWDKQIGKALCVKCGSSLVRQQTEEGSESA